MNVLIILRKSEDMTTGQLLQIVKRKKPQRLSKGGILLYETNNNISYTARAQLSYNKILNENHIINAMVGYEVRSVKNDGFNTEEWGYFPDRGIGN